MAGIGFVLRKLTRQDDLIGVLKGFSHSAVASSGPWFFTVLALAALSLLTDRMGNLAALSDFRIVIVYNFSFSLVMSGPLLIVMTRVLADSIFVGNVRAAPSMLAGGFIIILASQLPVAIVLYLVIATLEPLVAFLAIVNFLAISMLWLVSMFLSALKDYSAISIAFGAGMSLSILGGLSIAEPGSSAGPLLGFTLGVLMTVTLLLAKILAEYPYPIEKPFAFIEKCKPYGMLVASGLVYNMAVWIDKWIMWSAAESKVAASGLATYPHYDSAMFLAYLTITPSMAIFMMVVETRFYESYINFYRQLQRHANLTRILANHRELVRVLVDGLRNMMVVQATISLSVILLAPQIFEAMNIDFLQIGMFRLGVLGSLFQVFVLMLGIVLAYFDFRGPALAVQVMFLVTNGLFTWASLHFGFSWYGYGFFVACLVTFVFAYLLTGRYVYDLPYQTFIRNNRSIRGR